MERKSGRIFGGVVVFVMLISTLFASTLVNADVSQDFNTSFSKKLVEKPSTVRLIERLSERSVSSNNLFGAVVHINCDGVKVSKELKWNTYKAIDVDKNNTTGVNGMDVEVKYIVFPWVEFEPEFAVGMIFSLSVNRLGKEVKNKNLTVSLNTTIGGTKVEVGYMSPNETGNEVPDSVTVTFMPLYYPMECVGFRLALLPNYRSGVENKTLVLFTNYERENTEKGFSVKFDPAVETQVEFKPTKSEGEWKYTFMRFSEVETLVTAKVKNVVGSSEKETTVIVDKLPEEMSFSLQLTPFTSEGGVFLYESTNVFNVKLEVISSETGVCKYITLLNTPKKVEAKWNPMRLNGSYSLSVVSNNTRFMLRDTPFNPAVNLTVTAVQDLDLMATWNLSQPGNFTLTKSRGLVANLDFKIGDWYAKVNSRLSSDKLFLSWYLNVSGYISIDTDWQPASTTNVEMRSESRGFKVSAETLKAEDFLLQWVLWPPQEWNLSWSGEIDFVDLNIDIFSEGSWYHLWPLS
ncbi:MAG: hypothetical protein FE035_01640 [Thermoplasmata archaeon]|nr:MAG: hypothetical protein FE035_01640 [Thermoplasmata archaeon]